VPGLLDDLGLNTVCRSARCPNLAECWAKRTATFMILGERCTRECRFCAVPTAQHQGCTGYTGSRKRLESRSSCASLLDNVPLPPPDPEESARVAEAARRLGLRHVVVTSVTRDDLPDGGAAQFAATVRAIHDEGARAEVLVPDFRGDEEAVRTVLDPAPEVFGHNVETVPRLYPSVRPGADYERSLGVLETAAPRGHGNATSATEVTEDTENGESGGTTRGRTAVPVPSVASVSSVPAVIKSGLMVGLGETRAEVGSVLRDLRSAGCEAVTLGQYLQPDRTRLAVAEYVAPERFAEYEAEARELGFAAVAAGPFVRSSYMAAETWREAVGR
jgi:lipoic acid synthetase